MYKNIAEKIVNSRGIARFNFRVTLRESARELATILY